MLWWNSYVIRKCWKGKGNRETDGAPRTTVANEPPFSLVLQLHLEMVYGPQVAVSFSRFYVE